MPEHRLPRVTTPLPGPESQRLSAAAERFEAPGINALYGGHPNIFWREASGANVLDADGNCFVDLTAGFGVAAIGHRHPAVVEAVRTQSERLVHGLGDAMSHPERPRLAERLAALVPAAGDERQVYFAVSGSDAVEVALKTAALATDRPGIVAFEPAYHGLTLGSLQATSRGEFRRPFSDHFHVHVHRLPFGGPTTALEELLRENEVGAVICEPIVGREGILVPPEGWLRAVAEISREHGALLIADEILTGFGRTGKLFAVEHEGVSPDLICCGKALGGGLPIAAVVGRRELMAGWRTSGEALHTATFVGHPLACAAANAALGVLLEEKLVERAAEIGAEVGHRLESWKRLDAVEEIRGRGLFRGVKLADPSQAGLVFSRLLERGVMALASDTSGVVQIVPPLTIERRQLEVALDALEDVLSGLAAD